MPGGISRKRRARAINVTGLSESVDAFKALPATIRKQLVAVVNEVAANTRGDIVNRIAADGFNTASVRARIQLDKANASNDVATISLDLKKIPFSRVKFASQSTDGTGTRASVWVLRGGKRVQVYGFINPYGKKRRPMIRYKKSGKQQLVMAGGVGLRGWWNDIITEQFLNELQANLASTFTRRVT
ncbi:hypothetical protein LCG94_14975 [Aeromonas salmonicida]|uniref:hypothetical protein n=1 Tax=Aeromonas salmonicida TaxID=645 RepID=UPI003BB71B05